jgi:hypothetical protein
VVILVGDTTVNLACVPLKVTLLALVKSVPKTTTTFPTQPDVGTVSTKGGSPVDKFEGYAGA